MMAWTTPMTAAAQTLWTSAQWNTHVRDNLAETCTGKATTAGRWFVSTGANALAERVISSASNTAAGTTTSGSYTATLGGTPGTNPSVTVTTGTAALVFFNCEMESSSSSAVQLCSVAVSSATSISASDNWAIQCDGVTASNPNRLGGVAYFGGDNGALTAGSNVFTMQYRSNGSATLTVRNRSIIVFAM